MAMTPNEIAAKEKELADRAKAIADREAELAQQVADVADKGKAINTSPPTAPTPSPSTYATSIKIHVPITLDLAASTYTNWRELFLVALGPYGLTSHVLADAGATPSDTSPPQIGVEMTTRSSPRSMAPSLRTF